MPAQTVIRLRRDTAANWASTNPVLAAGEAGLETDSTLLKFGNGTSAWNALEYASSSSTRTKVLNQTGSPIAKGSVVYIDGANGDNPTIALADADTEATSSKTIGLVDATIANGAIGYVVESGLITGLNTASGTAGQSVWLSSTAGGFVFGTPPAKPANSVYLGVLIRANLNNGAILVKVQNGYELNELHDVNAGSPSTGQVLQWNGNAWVNATVDALPSQSGQNGKYLTTNGTTASWGTITIPPGTAVSDTAPSSPATGQLWWNSNTGILYIYYDNFWIEAVAGMTGPQGPSGAVQSTTAPTDTSVLWIDTDEAGDMVIPAGGTTGQTLVKATASDYDTTWANSPSQNYVINGAFEIWQRGTSFSSTGTSVFNADRWDTTNNSSGSPTLTISRSTDVPNPSFEYSVNSAISVNAATSIGEIALRTRFETQNIASLVGNTVTISFWYKSNVTGVHSLRLGLDANNLGTFANHTPVGFNYNTANVWQRVTQTFTNFVSHDFGTQNLNGYAGFLDIGPRTGGAVNGFGQTTLAVGSFWTITGVQMEAGSIATPFRRHSPSIAGELAACQRYYFRNTTAQTYGFFAGSGLAISTTVARFSVPFPVQMRTRPSSIEVGGALGAYDGNNYQTTGTWTLTGDTGTSLSQGVDYTHGSGVFTQYRPALIGANNNINTYIGFSAEL